MNAFNCRTLIAMLIGAWSLATAAPAVAQLGDFAAAASPSRFELAAKPGEVISRAIEIQHVGPNPTNYRLRSADWSLTEAEGLRFFDELQPGSCRPWLRLERRDVTLQPNVRRKIRFEVHVPADAPRRECQLAVMVEGADPPDMSLTNSGAVKLPVTGRLGIVVYVAIGGAEPRLEVLGIKAIDHQGERMPAVIVRNDGDAHGRLDGALDGSDQSGRPLLFPVSTLPILPGQTRTLPLVPAEDLATKKRPDLVFPVKVSGRLDWEGGQFKVDQELQ